MLTLDTPRLQLRQIDHGDFELFRKLHQDPEIIRLCFDAPPRDDIKKRFEERLPLWQPGSEHWLCMTVLSKSHQTKVGVTGFKVTNRVAEVGYLMLTEYQGMGIATESLQCILDWGISQLELSSFNAVVTRGNQASERVLEKCGFHLKAIEKNAYVIGGKTHDDMIYQRKVR
ncbi:Putative ribosomal N-acetyltransferase YdaF [Vibrio thalassae]|uniref:Ribosomal N-acetyltransferase YdaF n=1 Tax=Vibrio thalassae TaxID=1243014 RepID=A0A240EMZ1_9VIBR|nr:GNAT family N-acetyltransferase [Vibrio thalassae]SNX49340.1 Putative ribosomal N-acetyltransferase YdaF [Vibrio thalassae]